MSFVRYNPEDSVVSMESVSSPLWTGGLYTLSGSFFTSSAQEVSENGKFYLNVYNAAFGTTGSELQFAISYGHVSGSGSAPFNTLVPNVTPSRTVYGQYRTMILGDENSRFNFGGNNGISPDIFILNIARSRYKEALNPGSLNLTLKNGPDILNLTDNSGDTIVDSFVGANRFYYLVSGSNGKSFNTSSVQTNSGSYGLVFPDIATVILNPRALALPTGSGGINLSVDQTASTAYALSYNINNSSLFSTISAGSISGRSQETVSAKYLFTRVGNREFNYTTNPSVIDANGNLLYPSMVNSPDVFATTIGLYNDKNELLAVGKFSKPLKKNFVSELLIQIKLDF